ncbi:MAG: hypothetical protein ACTHJ9_16245 [Rhodanobacter sp.]
MNRSSILLVFIAALLFAPLALASKEGVLPLGTIHIESSGIGESGPVILSGVQTAQGMQSLTIEAFGKKFQLSPAQLRELQGGFFNGVQLSYESGYKETGGRTIYLLISKGFTSGAVAQRYIVVTENGTIKVGPEP